MTNKRCITTKGLSALLATIFISSHAFSSSQIDSEFELLLPRQFQQTLIEKKWETLMNEEFQGNWQLPDQQITAQDVPVNIKNISLKIKTYLQKPSLGNQTVLQLSSKNLQAELYIGEVFVDHVVERTVGGITGRFRIQASCKDVTLSMSPGKGSFSMVVSPKVQNSSAGTEVQSVDLSWLPGSWTSQGIQCEGVEGFGDILKNEINNIANDSAKFVEPQKELIKHYVQDSLNKIQLDFSQPRQLVVSRPDINVVMNVDEYKDLGTDGASVHGKLNIVFTRTPDQATKILKLDPTTSISKSTEANLRLPKDFVKEVLSRAYSANSWLHQVTSDKIPGFSTVMNSRFIQFFIWPALMSFSKSTKFLFDVYSNKDVNISGSGTQYQMTSTLYSRMQAPKNGSYVPFMNFTLPFSSKVQIKVENGKAQAYFANPTLGMTPQWASSYVSKYNPSKRFSTGTIRDKIISALWGKTVSVDIPKIPLTEGLSLNVKKIIAPTNQDITLQLQP